MAPQAVLETLRQLWLALHQTHTQAALIGGLALAAWRYPRATLDVDVLLSADEARLAELSATLRDAGFRCKRSQLTLSGDTDLLQFGYEPEGAYIDVQVDLLVAKSAYAHESLDRSVTLGAEVLGFEVQVLGCEDLILLKLLSGRIIDRVDVAELLRANAAVIRDDLLSSLAAKLRLADALAEARREVWG